MTSPLSETLYHLRPAIPGTPIQIVGIRHGVYGTHPPRAERKYMESLLRRHSGRLLTEGRQHETVLYDMVPRKYAKKAVAIENPTVYRLMQRLRSGYPSIFEYEKRREEIKLKRAELAKRIPGIRTQPETEENQRAYRQELDEVWKFIVNTRSVFMASELLSHRQKKEPIVFVTGASHASQIHLFLERPAYALKYIRLVKRNLLARFPDVFYLSHLGPNAQKAPKQLRENLLAKVREARLEEMEKQRDEVQALFEEAEKRFEEFLAETRN